MPGNEEPSLLQEEQRSDQQKTEPKDGEQRNSNGGRSVSDAPFSLNNRFSRDSQAPRNQEGMSLGKRILTELAGNQLFKEVPNSDELTPWRYSSSMIQKFASVS